MPEQFSNMPAITSERPEKPKRGRARRRGNRGEEELQEQEIKTEEERQKEISRLELRLTELQEESDLLNEAGPQKWHEQVLVEGVSAMDKLTNVFKSKGKKKKPVYKEQRTDEMIKFGAAKYQIKKEIAELRRRIEEFKI
jgi:hypothetical protein